MADLVERVMEATMDAILPFHGDYRERIAKVAIDIVLEEAAKWHDEQSKAAANIAREWANKIQSKRDAGGYERQFAHISSCHRDSAAAIRAMKGEADG